jgi:hypothetical protein
MIKFFLDFIDESYLYSNNAPLYHFTNTWSLNQILTSNELFIGHFDHKIDDRIVKIISLTRNRNFDVKYKEFDVKICLDKDKLINNYKLKPYDFFNTKSDKKKWEIDRINPYEFEEVVECNIKDLNKYILYIDFFEIDSIYTYLIDMKKYINKYNIECMIKEKIIDINEI